MPGTVIRVEVAPGDEVVAREPLVILEAMKMEIPVPSPFPATVKAVNVAAETASPEAQSSSSSRARRYVARGCRLAA